jgi:hypothetical protein
MWWYIPIIPATKKVEVEGLWSETGLGKKYETLSKTKLKPKDLGWWLKWQECTPSKCKALNSNPNAEKKRNTGKSVCAGHGGACQ